MCARDGRGTIEVCFSEKGALAKKAWETLIYTLQPLLGAPLKSVKLGVL